MNKKYRKNGTILDIAITSKPKGRLLTELESDLEKKRKVMIVTPNPEIILEAQDDNTLLQILNKADISLPDGVGLVAWHKFLGLPNPKDKFRRMLTLFVQALGVEFSILFNRKWLYSDLRPIHGRDFAFDLIELSAKKELKVFLLGGEGNEANKAMRKLKSRMPSLRIQVFKGPYLDKEGKPVTKADEVLEKRTVSLINKFAPDILFVGMGAPKQEKWMYRYFSKINAIIFMGVGGTFKYLAGQTPLPPKWIDDAGLAWLWRLVIGDQTTERIINALFVFPWKVFLAKLND